jgi:aspartyl protease family protein
LNELVKASIALTAAACIGGVLFAKSFETKPPVRAEAVAAPSPPKPQQPSPAAGAGHGTVVLPPGRGGHYHADVEIDGRRIPMMVDTGASVIALTAEDARAIGVNVFPADYTASVSTANGVARAAPAMLREVRIEGITVRDVQALVMPRGAMGQSLLGMSFLRGFEIADGKMVMRQ